MILNCVFIYSEQENNGINLNEFINLIFVNAREDLSFLLHTFFRFLVAFFLYLLVYNATGLILFDPCLTELKFKVQICL